jgi:hypothetical protein
MRYLIQLFLYFFSVLNATAQINEYYRYRGDINAGDNNQKTTACREEMDNDINLLINQLNDWENGTILNLHKLNIDWSMRLMSQNCRGMDSTLEVVPFGIYQVMQTFYDLRILAKMPEKVVVQIQTQKDQNDRLAKLVAKMKHPAKTFHAIKRNIFDINNFYFTYYGYGDIVDDDNRCLIKVNKHNFTFKFAWEEQKSRYKDYENSYDILQTAVIDCLEKGYSLKI